MSQIFEALQRSNANKAGAVPARPDLNATPAVLTNLDFEATGLAQVPTFTVVATPECRLAALAEKRSLGAEKIRILGAWLRHLRQQRPLKTILITSSIKNEGKSVLATNLAISIAKTRQRVLLLDGDCHQPTIARLLGANGQPGLTHWWRSGEPVLNHLRRVDAFPLWLLAAGEPMEQPLEMLQSTRLSELVAQAGMWFDWVIIDSPPVAPLADSAVWANLADGILFIIRQGKTPKRLLRKVLEAVDRTKLLGLVLNECTDPDHSYYARYYGRSPKQ